MQNKPKRILIIEDDATLRDILKDSLTDEGYAVLEAQNGEEGLRQGLSGRPHLILLDILLPDEDGLAVLKRIRADEAWGKHVKVIMLTNLSDNQSVAAALDLGAHSFLVKSDWKIQDVIGVIHEELRDWPAED
jgi:DNA-binding response OmpR family regulator